MTQEVRTYYADSVHAVRKGGLMQIPLVEGIEVPAEGLCAYIDDVTLAGQLSSVNVHNQRLYVVETTPVSFDFTGIVDAVGEAVAFEVGGEAAAEAPAHSVVLGLGGVAVRLCALGA